MTTPKTHFMPAGNATFEKRQIPTKQDYIWFLDIATTDDDPLMSELKRSQKRNHKTGARFGQWLYTRRTKEFQARYNAMLKAPKVWESIRNTVAKMQVEEIGGNGR
jgi:hypothetical protein